jgi:hypothetical protein
MPDVVVPPLVGTTGEILKDVGGGQTGRLVATSSRVNTVAISGPAPANGATFVQFTTFTPQTWTSADITVGAYHILAINFDVTALTAGTAQLLIDRADPAGTYFNLATGVAKTGVATDVISLGPGLPLSTPLGTATGVSAWSVPWAFADIIRCRVIVVSGNLTGTLSIKGK